MPRSRPAHAAAAVVAAAATTALGFTACADEPTGARAPNLVPRAAVLVTDPAGPALYRPPAIKDDDGVTDVYLLAKACDVMIGRNPLVVPDLEDPGPAVSEFHHQLYVDVPEGAFVRLVTPDELQQLAGASLPPGFAPDAMVDGGATFGCDSNDPDSAGVAVVDPLTNHAAKGNGPSVFTRGVTLDLNGYGVTSHVGAAALRPPGGLPTPLTEPLDNIGIVIAGEDQRLVNRADRTARITGFGHNLDIEGSRVVVEGRTVDDGAGGVRYNLESQGAGARLGGDVRLSRVKLVDTVTVEEGTGAPIGTGFEARNCTGPITVEDSHVEGSGDGVFIRECSNVVLRRNVVTSSHGHGVGMRRVAATAAAPIVIRDNVIATTGLDAIDFGYDEGRRSSAAAGALVIEGNAISAYGTLPPDAETPAACGIANTSGSVANLPYDSVLVANNAIAPVAGRAATCGFASPPPPNRAPTAVIGGAATLAGNEGSAITFSSTGSRDPEGGALRYQWTFSDGTTSTAASPAKTFADNGTYTATLVVTDVAGLASTPASKSVVVANVAPVARLRALNGTTEVTSRTVARGTTVSFRLSYTDAGTRDQPASYVISWADGTAVATGSIALPGTAGRVTVGHQFTTVGRRSVTATVTDKDGRASAVQTVVITVQ